MNLSKFAARVQAAQASYPNAILVIEGAAPGTGLIVEDVSITGQVVTYHTPDGSLDPASSSIVALFANEAAVDAAKAEREQVRAVIAGDNPARIQLDGDTIVIDRIDGRGTARKSFME